MSHWRRSLFCFALVAVACSSPAPVVHAPLRSEATGPRTAAAAVELPTYLGTRRWRHYGLHRLAISHRGDRLLSSRGYGDLKLFDAGTGQLLQTIESSSEAMALSGDGTVVVAVSAGWEGAKVRLVDARSGKALREISTVAEVEAVALSFDGRYLAVALGKADVQVFDTSTGERLLSWRPKAGPTRVLLWTGTTSPRLVAGHDIGTVTVLGMPDGKLVREVALGKHKVTALAATPDGERIAAIDREGQVHILAASSGVRLTGFATKDAYLTSGLALTPDGTRVVTGSHDGSLRLWNAETGREMARLLDHSMQATAVVVTADGRFVYGGSYGGVIRKWSAENGDEIELEPRGNLAPVLAFEIAANGEQLIAAGGSRDVLLWDLKTRRAGKRLRGHDDTVTAVALGPVGKLAATGGFDRTIRVWDLATQRVLRSCFGHERGVSALAFSPDGRLLASGGRDGSVIVQSADLARVVHEIHPDTDSITALAWSPDGSFFAYGDSFGHVVLVDSSTGWVSVSLEDSYPDRVKWIGFSPDGAAFVVAAGDSLWVYDAATAADLAYYSTPGTSFSSGDWSPATGELAIADDDGHLWLIDIRASKVRAHIFRRDEDFNAVRFDPDGEHVYVSRDDTTIAIWDVEQDVRGGAADTTDEDDQDGDVGVEIQTSAGSASRRTRPPSCGAVERDAVGDRLPPCAVQRLGSTRFRSAHDVGTAAFSPDSKRLATGEEQSEAVEVWEVGTGVALHRFHHSEIGTGDLAFAGTGHLAASDSIFSRNRIWDLSSGRKYDVITGARATALASTRDGGKLLIGDKQGRVRFWEVASRRFTKRIATGVGKVGWMRLSPDGKHLAVASPDGVVAVSDLPSGEAVELDHDTLGYGLPGFLSDGRLIVASEEAAFVQQMDGSFSEGDYRLPAGFEVESVDLGPGGRVVLLGEREIALWQPAGMIERIPVGDYTGALLAPDGDTLAVFREMAVEIWSASRKRPTLRYDGHEHWVRWVGASADRAFTWDGSAVREWSLFGGKLVREIAVGGAPALSADGHWLATAEEKQITLRNLRRGSSRALRVRDSGYSGVLAFSGDGRWLVAREDDGTAALALFDVARGKRLRGLGKRREESVFALAVDGRGERIAVARGPIVELFARGGRRLAVLRGHDQAIGALAIAWDGSAVATASDDGSIRLWSDAGTETARLDVEHFPIRGIALSRDARHLAAGDLYGHVWIWEVASQTLVARFDGHEGLVTSVAFAGGTERLVTGSWDATALVWDLSRLGRD